MRGPCSPLPKARAVSPISRLRSMEMTHLRTSEYPLAAATCSAVAPERACLVSCIFPLLSHCRASCSRHCSSSLRDWSRSTPAGAHGTRSWGCRPDGLGPQTHPGPQTTCPQQLCFPSPHEVSDSPSQCLRGIHLKLLPAQEHKDHICTKLHVSTSSYMFVTPRQCLGHPVR